MSELVNQVRSQLVTAIKSKNESTKDILRVVLGDLSTLESRSGKSSTDDDVRRVVKKLIEGNFETLKYANQKVAQKLATENDILSKFLPKTLSSLEIKNFLMQVFNDILEAKSDGQATGIAVKFIKKNGLDADGTDVANVVKQIRQR